ncbi:Ino80ep [Desmophyllum pertusum]|uniref:Ino80ep n=1 Tax=Desmophyllum pertusum TaxID=174260 RepID=A0A9W9Z2K6_9CNID|nr:Ino80ep [Desmophyllum pertusum]
MQWKASNVWFLSPQQSAKEDSSCKPWNASRQFRHVFHILHQMEQVVLEVNQQLLTTRKSIQCKYVNNGHQCQERISKRSKSGYCNAHRTVIRISKQAVASSPKQLHTNSKPVPDPQRDNSSMVDQQQLERLHQLSESSSCRNFSHATGH